MRIPTSLRFINSKSTTILSLAIICNGHHSSVAVGYLACSRGAGASIFSESLVGKIVARTPDIPPFRGEIANIGLYSDLLAMDVKAEKRVYPTGASEYELLEEVGHGVSAVVYRAVCTRFKSIVAIKCLDLDRCNCNLEDIRREAQLMSLIDHPNIIKACCSFVVDHFLWVVMPYMEGGSCLHIMKVSYPDGFEENIIATILKETLKAIDYLHRQGHIHRDVKAGNILMDTNGAVKLGDFGVSACMFDRGDRQRSRNTIVGTPCWMAPEVMEQKHGYDFRADIWSFGITALELAHGHAPFSKYPPMKVLLMTIQHAPPGLDYERDKRFSKAFREMLAMCLVKDPSKRPTAEKLLKHSFFKQAKSSDYIMLRLLHGLSPLWERERTLRDKDAALLAQKKTPYAEQEEKSQNEYKRGVSCWNFDIEDLKAQAALIQDEDESSCVKDEDVFSRTSSGRDIDDSSRTSSQVPSPPPSGNYPGQQSNTLLPLALTARTLVPGQWSSGKKEPKQIGRFDVFEGDLELESPGWHEIVRQRKIIEDQQRDQKEHLRAEDRGRDGLNQRGQEALRVSSGPLIPDRVIAALKSGDEGSSLERDKSYDPSIRACEEVSHSGAQKDRLVNGVSNAASSDQRSANGFVGLPRTMSGSKDGVEEKSKVPPVQRKGRFSVTSADTRIIEDIAPSVTAQKAIRALTTPFHKSASVGDSLVLTEPKQCSSSQLSSSSSIDTSTVPVGLLVPQLKHLLLQTATQHETIFGMLKAMSPADALDGHSLSHPISLRLSQKVNGGGEACLVAPSTVRECDRDHLVSELQSKVTSLTNELLSIKLRNIQLERQLNTIYNREEEERIRREEAANGHN